MDPLPGFDNGKEGKFRQVRKMTAAVGFTLRLFRVRIGNVYLDDLQSGKLLKLKIYNSKIKGNVNSKNR
jgi:23S rRNA pseudouridine2457 synthase